MRGRKEGGGERLKILSFCCECVNIDEGVEGGVGWVGRG